MKTQPIEISPHILRGWPLPQPEEDGDKEGRGRALVVGGSWQMPGACILAGTAALRAGAGKLQIITGRSVSLFIAASIPEGRCFAQAETEDGGIRDSAVPEIAERANSAQSVLLGPGLIDFPATAHLVNEVLPRVERAPVILDATALCGLKDSPHSLQPVRGRAVITPHAGEMAAICGMEKDAVRNDPQGTAMRAAEELGVVVALKGATTYIAAPDGALFCNTAGGVGLATSGSGDVLAGIMGGLAARGCGALQAAVWGVYLHACSGDRLARRIGRLGFLARELLEEIPGMMEELGR